MELGYNAEDLIEKHSGWENFNEHLTKFDKLLSLKWKEAVKSGIFKYTLDDCRYKVIQNGTMRFVAQLNPQRVFKRRKREEFKNMNVEFSNSQFNFTKIKPHEILFTLHPGENTALFAENEECSSRNDHTVAVNISPIDDCHVLLVPELNKCLPQKITTSSLLMAFDLIQLSGHPGFRVGFNSLHAWASINHLHYHAMYCNYPLFIDDHPASTHVKANCYLLDDSPVPAFVFCVPTPLELRTQVANEVTVLVDLLHEREIPYNAIVARGNQGTRLALFPRRSMKDQTPSPGFDVACVEVGGQFPIKRENEFEKLTFDEACETLREARLDQGRFLELVEAVKTAL